MRPAWRRSRPAAAGSFNSRTAVRPSFARERCWEDLDGTFLPGAAPLGWAAVVRPDRTVLHDGPAREADRIVRESLALLGSPIRAEAAYAAAPAAITA